MPPTTTTTTTVPPTTTTTAAPTTTTTTTPGNVPTTKEQCKNGGWRQFGFKNQGTCIDFVMLNFPPPEDGSSLTASLARAVRPETPAQYGLLGLAAGFGLLALGLALPLRRRP